MGNRGVTPQNEACMSVRCGKCILCRGIEFENICCGGVQQTRANGYINFSISIYARMGVLHLNPVDLFFPEKPTENCENQKITWEYLGSPKNKFRWYPQQPQRFYFYKSF